MTNDHVSNPGPHARQVPMTALIVMEGGSSPRGVNKQKNMAAERKNRRSLGDIGNRVTVPEIEGKPLPQICRPVTRSFCAQLLANAQAAAAENNKKKSMAVNANDGIAVDGAMPKAVVKKPAPNTDTTKPKPKPEEVIDISSDRDEVKKERAFVNKENTE
ncbi:G2 mitotic-specific cyclin S13-7-like [Olea europaea subsp. europaea]|uniref:G2 mitotic-specific cyclin S13-7-like n=1 Tax=Olea europaea subsp. europaea TaxID=158383 RepID=A0A8S0QU60_OLEEU|nr:G2 mitotic-specific cyclin S13-7-like [Olea europaea subsp. europaea]